MNIAIVDLYNLIIRYASFIDEDNEEDIDTALQILTRLIEISNTFDLLILVSDEGKNERTNAILSGQYKANRNKSGKHLKRIYKIL